MAENFGLVSKSMKPRHRMPIRDNALKLITVRTKLTEILYIFCGINTANEVQLADRIEQSAQLALT